MPFFMLYRIYSDLCIYLQMQASATLELYKQSKGQGRTNMES